LTAWGYNFVDSDPDVAFGNVLYRLLMRSFPGWYQYNSVYAFFPFNTPTRVKEILTAMGIDKFFSWDPPREGPNPIVFSTAVNVRNILENYELFKVVWGPAILRLTQGNDYMLAGDKPSNFAQHEDVYKAMYSDVTDWATEVWDFYTTYTEKLIRENAVSMGDFYEVDAVAEYQPHRKRLTIASSTWFTPISSVNISVFRLAKISPLSHSITVLGCFWAASFTTRMKQDH